MDFEKYENRLPYPNIESVRRRLMSAFDNVPMTKWQRQEKEGELEAEAQATYREQVATYRAKDNELRSQFFADAHDKLGISYLPEPILAKLDDLAVGDDGHIEDFSRIFSDLRNLAELATLAYGVGMARQEYVERKGLY